MCMLVDIKKNITLDSKTVLAVDTNVLLWMFYSRIVVNRAYQTQYYPQFISDAISRGNSIIVTSFNLNEMFHAIERNEYKIFLETSGKNINLKDFRKSNIERSKVQKEIALISKQIKQIPNIRIVDSQADERTLDSFVNKYELHKCDFFDFSLINYSIENQCAIVTDDIDFLNMYNQATVFTANPRLMKNA